MKRSVLAVLVLTWAIVLSGCSAAEKKRSREVFADQREAERAMKAMADAPRPLQRPVILLTGWAEAPSGWARFQKWLEAATCGCDRQILVPDLRGPGGLMAAAEKVVELCAEMGDVDVVAHSAGGLIAREAARKSRGGRRLHVARLLTIATPHQGTAWGKFWPILPYPLQAADCRPASGFIASLDNDMSTTSMAISTYWTEGDIVVPKESAEAVGGEHHAYARPRGFFIHRRCAGDPRLARDVIAKLLAATGAEE
ncbi:MAG: alpha/beta hydrolase [Planctomycetes bacterium]|nr:alpha/beta hydrolase [Planctomycetota bacterium]